MDGFLGFLIDWLIDWWMDWLTDWLIDCWFTDWLIDFRTESNRIASHRIAAHRITSNRFTEAVLHILPHTSAVSPNTLKSSSLPSLAISGPSPPPPILPSFGILWHRLAPWAPLPTPMALQPPRRLVKISPYLFYLFPVVHEESLLLLDDWFSATHHLSSPTHQHPIRVAPWASCFRYLSVSTRASWLIKDS